MNESRIAFRWAAMGAGFGLVGATAGGLLEKFAANEFAGSPAWQLPAVVVGSIAAMVVGVLIVAAIIEGRGRGKHKASA